MGFKGKSGGGFWNGVDAEFKGYSFETFKSKKDGVDYVNFIPEVREDGKEANTSTRLLLGKAEFYTVSEDGLSLSSQDGRNASYSSNSPGGHWLDSFVDAGEKEGIGALLPDLDAGEAINLEALIGTRFRLGRIDDEYGNRTKGPEVGSDGVSRPRHFKVVEQVYSLPKAAAKGASKSASRTNGSGKANTAVRDAADTIVTAMLNGGELPVSKIQAKAKMTVLRSDIDKTIKDAVSKMIGDVAYIADAAERGVFAYDGDAETVSAA